MEKGTIDINESTIKNCVEWLRPENLEILKQEDIGYSYDGNTIILFQIRPDWQDANKKHQLDFAKIRYFKSKKEWCLYWMRANGKWEAYTPFPESNYLDKIIDVIKHDENGCFFG